MVEIWTRLSEKDRVIRLIKTFMEVPEDTTIDIRSGFTEAGTPSILVSIGGNEFPMLAESALAAARIIEDTIRQFGADTGMAQLADGLRFTAKYAAEQRPAPKDQPQ